MKNMFNHDYLEAIRCIRESIANQPKFTIEKDAINNFNAIVNFIDPDFEFESFGDEFGMIVRINTKDFNNGVNAICICVTNDNMVIIVPVIDGANNVDSMSITDGWTCDYNETAKEACHYINRRYGINIGDYYNGEEPVIPEDTEACDINHDASDNDIDVAVAAPCHNLEGGVNDAAIEIKDEGETEEIEVPDFMKSHDDPESPILKTESDDESVG